MGAAFSSKNIGIWIVKWRWLILLVSIAPMLFLGMAMGKRVKEYVAHVAYMEKVRNDPKQKDPQHKSAAPIFNPDYHVFFNDDNEEMVAFDEFQKEFTKEDSLVVVVKAKNGSIFTNENLATLQELTDRFWTVPYVYRVDGLVNFNTTTAVEDDIAVEKFITNLPLDEVQLKAKRDFAIADPLIPKFLLSKDTSLTQISLKVIAPLDFPTAYADSTNGAKKIITEVLGKNPNLEARLGGAVMVNYSFQEFAIKDNQTLMPLMFAFIIVVLVLIFRSFWGTVLPLLLAILTIAFVIFLFVGLLGHSLTNVSNSVPQILLGIVLAEAIHLLTSFFRALRRGLSRRDAVIDAVDKNFYPCFFTSFTTAIGFFTMITMEIRPFADMGINAGVGVMWAWILSVFTLPAALAVLPIRAKKNAGLSEEAEEAGPVARRYTAWVIRYQRPIRWFFYITGIGSVACVPLMNIDASVLNYFDDDTEFYQASKYIDQNIVGTNPIDFSFDSGSPDGVKDPAFLQKIERFQKWVEGQDFGATHISSINDVIKRLNKTMHGDRQEFYRIPTQDEIDSEGQGASAKNLIGQYLLLYTMSLPQGMDLNNQITLDYRKTRVTVFLPQMAMTRQLEIVAKMNAWLKQEMPEVGGRGVGISQMFARLTEISIPGMLNGQLTSLVFITLCMIVALRSWRFGLFSMIPNIWPIVFVYGGLGAMGVMVDLAVSSVAMITLGIAVDDTTHYLMKFQRIRKKGYSVEESLMRTFSMTADALFYLSALLLAGFGVLGFSDFKINSTMGIMSAVIIAIALFADLLMLPAFLLLMKDKGGAVKAA